MRIISTQDPPIDEEFKDLRFKLKESYKREQLLEKEAQRRNQHILKILAESSRIKDSLRLLSNKTGYDPLEGRIKPENAPFVYERKQKKGQEGENDGVELVRLDVREILNTESE